MQSRSHAKLPPNTTYPLHFICTSTAQGQECILADEEELKEEGEKEAAAVLEAVQKYCIPWPRMEWGPEDMDSICIIAPSRMQVSVCMRIRCASVWVLKYISGAFVYVIFVCKAHCVYQILALILNCLLNCFP